MAKDHGPQVKDDEKYEALRDKGYGKEKAARIANSGKEASEQGGRSKEYEDRTKEDLYEKAKDVGIEGRAEMDKDGLIEALRDQ